MAQQTQACRHRTFPESRCLLTGCWEARPLVSENVVPGSPPPAATLGSALPGPFIAPVRDLRLHFVTKPLQGVVRDAVLCRGRDTAVGSGVFRLRV